MARVRLVANHSAELNTDHGVLLVLPGGTVEVPDDVAVALEGNSDWEVLKEEEP